MLSEKEIDNIMLTYALDETFVKTDTPPLEEPKVEEPPKKKRKGRPKKTVSIKTKPKMVDSSTQTTEQEKYENAILSEEFVIRERYIKKQMIKYSGNPEKFKMFENGLKMLQQRYII